MRGIARLFAAAARDVRTTLVRLVGRPGDRPRSRRGHTSLVAVSGLGAVGLAAGAAGTWSVPAPEPDRATRALVVAAAAKLVAGDTVTVFGPRTVEGNPGAGLLYIERFTVASPSGRLYLLRLQNGSVGGGDRVSSARVQLNGAEIVGLTEVNESVGELVRTVALTEVDTIQVTAIGAAGSHVTVSIIGTPDPTFNVVGPTTYTVPLAVLDSTTPFTLPAGAAPPYRLYLINGANDGTRRVEAGTVTVNGAPEVFTLLTGSLTKSVSLNSGSSNTLRVTLSGLPASFVQVRLTATDTTAPVLTIATPAPGAVVGAVSVNVTGTLQDHTATTVTVNGTAASVTNNTSYSASVPLPAEGSHLLTVTAIDAAGKRTDSTRTVVRDTEAPTLTVSAPSNGTVTQADSVTVSGTVSDATPLTVNVNGTPLTVGAGGAFSAKVALTEGGNVLTVTATDAAGNSASEVRTVTRDRTPPVLIVSAPAEGATTSADSILVSGTATDASAVRVLVSGVAMTVGSAGAFSGRVALAPGSNPLVVLAIDALGQGTTLTRTVTRTGGLPPDPATVASAIDPTTATTFEPSIAFLYSGANRIQTGVAAGTIKPLRAAVFKGRTLDQAGQPLSGAAVTVVAHPEFGSTYTRANGGYDLAVNGGDQLVLSFAKAGYLPVQRVVTSLFQDFVVVEDVALTPPDTAVTRINFTAPVETAQGSVVSDTSGTRRATLLFEQGTQATMTLADGTVQALASINVRATEFTVGPRGPAQMPGTLPASSAYTYAVDLTVDEAQAAGAKEVRFSRPVALYNDNFLGVPVGAKIPVGYYDQVKGRWVPSQDGRVIKIVGTTGGRADVDITGDGVAEDSTALAGLGIDNAERDRLATLYPSGKSLWRVEVTHFTSWDSNLGSWFPSGWTPPTGRPYGSDPTSPCPEGGSIIECETLTLGEEIPIAGTGYFLAYRSDRQRGRVGKGTLRIPLTPATVPSGVKRVELTVEVAGQSLDSSFAPTPNRTFVYSWDGRDAYGRLVQGAQRARIGVGYVYDAVYQTPSQLQTETFGQYMVSGVTAIKSRQEIIAWQYQEVMLGGLDARTASGLGGWTLSAHHFYDPGRRILYLGTGQRRDADGLAGTITTLAGTGVAGFSGDGGPAAAAQLNFPVGVAVGPDGSVYISEYNNMRIRKVDPQGIITTVAGTGSRVVSGDGGPACQVSPDLPYLITSEIPYPRSPVTPRGTRAAGPCGAGRPGAFPSGGTTRL